MPPPGRTRSIQPSEEKCALPGAFNAPIPLQRFTTSRCRFAMYKPAAAMMPMPASDQASGKLPKTIQPNNIAHTSCV